jgi:hypothetical protein
VARRIIIKAPISRPDPYHAFDELEESGFDIIIYHDAVKVVNTGVVSFRDRTITVLTPQQATRMAAAISRAFPLDTLGAIDG